MLLPLNLPKRGLSFDEAAEYCGVSKNTLTRHGPAPIKIGERSVFDRKILDRWLDELAGLLPGSSSVAVIDGSEETLLEAIHARQATLRRKAR